MPTYDEELKKKQQALATPVPPPPPQFGAPAGIPGFPPTTSTGGTTAQAVQAPDPRVQEKAASYLNPGSTSPGGFGASGSWMMQPGSDVAYGLNDFSYETVRNAQGQNPGSGVGGLAPPQYASEAESVAAQRAGAGQYDPATGQEINPATPGPNAVENPLLGVPPYMQHLRAEGERIKALNQPGAVPASVDGYLNNDDGRSGFSGDPSNPRLPTLGPNTDGVVSTSLPRRATGVADAAQAETAVTTGYPERTTGGVQASAQAPAGSSTVPGSGQGGADNSYLTEAERLLRDRITSARDAGQRNIAEHMASRGIVGSSAELVDIADLESGLQQNYQQGLLDIYTQSQDMGLRERAMRLSELTSDRDEAFRWAQLESDSEFRRLALEFQEKGMAQDEAYRQAELEWRKQYGDAGLGIQQRDQWLNLYNQYVAAGQAPPQWLIDQIKPKGIDGTGSPNDNPFPTWKGSVEQWNEDMKRYRLGLG